VDASTNEDLARRFVEHFNNGTWDAAMYAPGATVWHNTDEVDELASSRVEFRKGLQRLVGGLRFDDVRIRAWDDGFAAQYVVRGTLPGGAELRIPACLIGTTKDGRIARLQEYVDSAHAAPLREAAAALFEQQPG
jgi:ketosteroid isomerase-like protein